MMQQVYIYDAIRTPIGRYGGALSGVRTDDLAALPIKYLKDQNKNEEVFNNPFAAALAKLKK